MWNDRYGISRTTTIPDPTVLMSQAFVDSLAVLVDEQGGALRRAVHDASDAEFDENLTRQFDPEIEAVFAIETPEAELLVEAVHSVDDLIDAIAVIDPRWRLDAITALAQYLDEDEDNARPRTPASDALVGLLLLALVGSVVASTVTDQPMGHFTWARLGLGVSLSGLSAAILGDLGSIRVWVLKVVNFFARFGRQQGPPVNDYGVGVWVAVLLGAGAAGQLVLMFVDK